MKSKLFSLAAFSLLGLPGIAGAQIIILPVDYDFSAPGLPSDSITGISGGDPTTGWSYSTGGFDTQNLPHQAGIVTATAAGGVGDANNAQFDAPAGTQAAFLQNSASISQDVALPTGNVSLSFEIEGRSGPTYSVYNITPTPDEIEITLGNTVLYDGTPTNTGTDGLLKITTDAISFAAGTYELKISGLTTNDSSVSTPSSSSKDTISFVTDVQLSVAETPEPSTWALLLAGGAVLGYRLRRNWRV